MRFATLFSRLLQCRPLAWLLALVVAIQATSAAMWTVQGPVHQHAARGDAFALIDFRREAAKAEAQRGGVLSWFGHGHGHVSAERHHHAPSDASMLATGDDLTANSLDAGAAMLLLALLAARYSWQAADSRLPRAFRPLWVPMTHDLERLEHPPRAA